MLIIAWTSQTCATTLSATERALPESGEHLYALEFAPELSGRIEYRLRAYPAHELLAHPFETGLMTWL